MLCNWAVHTTFIISWVRLHEEMKLDMQRIWKRNLGRDDRCIADNGKEVILIIETNGCFSTFIGMLMILLFAFIRLDSPF